MAINVKVNLNKAFVVILSFALNGHLGLSGVSVQRHVGMEVPN